MEGEGLLFTLCALTGIGVALNIILLVWQSFKVKIEKGFSFIKYSLLLLNAGYSLTGLALIFILLYKDSASDVLCKAGGFIILFATQWSLWLLASAVVGLYLWRKKVLPKDFQGRNKTIYLLIVIAQCIILIPVSALPFTKLQYFDNVEDYYYLCTPLRLPGEQGWAFSTLIVILDWIALAISAITLTIVSVRYSTCRDPKRTDVTKYFEDGAIPVKRLQRMLFINFCTSTSGWLVLILITSISYFSNGKLDKISVQWILGFAVTFTVSSYPLVMFGYYLVTMYVLPRTQPAGASYRALLESCPKEVESIHKVQTFGQDSGVSNYLVQWRDVDGGMITGWMKVYGAGVRARWAGEVNALARLGSDSHPNVVRHLWAAPTNKLAPIIQAHTGDIMSIQASIVCRMHYSHGSLHEFLAAKIDHLSEVSLHKVTLDVAGGLEFLHEHNLVHNGLTAHSVYMTSASEKIGVRVAIGDFENSYEVLPSRKDSTATSEYLRRSPFLKPGSPDLFTITSHIEFDTALNGNRFAPDIRSFGLIVLEMLVAMSEYNQKRKLITQTQGHLMARSQDDINIQERSRSLEPIGVHLGIPHGHSDVHSHDGVICSCSTSVTDVRAYREDSNQYRTFLQQRNNQEAITMDSPQESDHSSHIHCSHCMCDKEHNIDDQMIRPYPRNINNDDSLLLRIPTYQSVVKVKRPSHDSESRSSQWSTPVVEIHHESGESDTDAMLDSRMRPGSRSRISPRRGIYKQILTNGSFLTTPRTTPEIFSKMNQSDACTSTIDLSSDESLDSNKNEDTKVSEPTNSSKKDIIVEVSKEEEEIPPPLPERGVPVVRRGFQTIYEEEENVKSEDKQIEKETIIAERQLSKLSPKKRRMPPPPPPPVCEPGHTSEGGRRKRLSIASMDESVVSADSGVGSSHYDSYSTVSGSTDNSSLYFKNTPGTREPFYAMSSSVSETDSAYYVSRFTKPLPKTADSGIESNDELSRCDMSMDSEECLSDKKSKIETQNDKETSGKVLDTTESLYEKLPDIVDHRQNSPRKCKQPCIGQHAHLDGTPCHAEEHDNKIKLVDIKYRPRHPSPLIEGADTKSSLIENHREMEEYKPEIPPKPHMLKPKIPPKPKHLAPVERQNMLEEQWRQLVDKATNTTPPNNSPEPELEAIMENVENNPPAKSQITDSLARSGSTPWYRAGSDDREIATQPKKLESRDRFYPGIVDNSSHLSYNVAVGHGDAIPWFATSAHHVKGVLPERPTPVYLHMRKDSYDTDISESTSDSAHRSGYVDEYDRKRLYKRHYEPHYISRGRQLQLHRKGGLARPVSARSSSTSGSPMSLDRTDSDTLSIATSTYSDPATYHGQRHLHHNTPEPRSGVGHKHVQYCTQLAGIHAGISAGTMLNANEVNVKAMMNEVKDTGKLGFVAGKLVPLMVECWLEDPVPSADDILQRLGQVLPSATV